MFAVLPGQGNQSFRWERFSYCGAFRYTRFSQQSAGNFEYFPATQFHCKTIAQYGLVSLHDLHFENRDRVVKNILKIRVQVVENHPFDVWHNTSVQSCISIQESNEYMFTKNTKACLPVEQQITPPETPHMTQTRILQSDSFACARCLLDLKIRQKRKDSQIKFSTRLNNVRKQTLPLWVM